MNSCAVVNFGKTNYPTARGTDYATIHIGDIRICAYSRQPRETLQIWIAWRTDVNRMTGLSGLRVLIAEDQSLVRQGIVALIEDDVDNVIECSDGSEALEILKRGDIDLALLDIGLPGRTGLDILTETRNRQLPVKIVILTGDTHSYSPAMIYKAGADGFLYKTADADNFKDVVQAVAAGRSVPEGKHLDGENAASIAQLRDTLTARELQIVKLIVEGSSNRKVAESLFISEHTVRKHREHINQKLDVHSPASLAAFAIKASLV